MELQQAVAVETGNHNAEPPPDPQLAPAHSELITGPPPSRCHGNGTAGKPLPKARKNRRRRELACSSLGNSFNEVKRGRSQRSAELCSGVLPVGSRFQVPPETERTACWCLITDAAVTPSVDGCQEVLF